MLTAEFSKRFPPLYFQVKAQLLVASLLYPFDDVTVLKASLLDHLWLASQLGHSCGEDMVMGTVGSFDCYNSLFELSLQSQPYRNIILFTGSDM